MRFLLIFLLSLSTNAFSQEGKEKITLEKIWSGQFRSKGIQQMVPAKGNNFTAFGRVGANSSVDLYNYSNFKLVKTLVNSKDLPFDNFGKYKLSKDESKIILSTKTEHIYRHSSKSIDFVYDVKTKKTKQIFDKKIKESSFSNDNKKVAFVFDNNLFVKNLGDNSVTQITFDGEKNKIINGHTDWVYEEEFSFTKAYIWSKNAGKIAFLKFNESDVNQMKIPFVKSDKILKFKYPKAGDKNSKVTLHIYDFKSKKTTQINFKNYEYIIGLDNTNIDNIISVKTLNRHQNNLKLYTINIDDNSTKLIHNEIDSKYISMDLNTVKFIENNEFLYTSEKDGYNHIYHYSNKGKLIKQITSGKDEISQLYGYHKGVIFYQKKLNNGINTGIFSSKIGSSLEVQFSKKEGQNDATFSKNFDYFLNTFSDSKTPPIFTLNSTKEDKTLVIQDNNSLNKKAKKHNLGRKEFFEIKNSKGDKMNAWMIKPINFSKDKKYPLLMFVYGGPNSQTVTNSWANNNDIWYEMLSQKDYIVVSIDGRGTGGKGAKYKKSTYLQLGKYELEDQTFAAKELSKIPYIDKDCIGIWGWSFGGYLSSLAITKSPEVFKMAIAVAPVTSWRYYDSVYTERFMQTPKENPSGYDDNSPINFAKNIKGNYLIIHGTADDNVHFANTKNMIKSMDDNNIHYDKMIFEDKNHGIYGGKTRLILYKKLTDFIENNL